MPGLTFNVLGTNDEWNVLKKKNYNSKREDKKEEDQPEDERNVIL